jgi:pimeloyl-ACP methyl ester carboxylesterase
MITQSAELTHAFVKTNGINLHVVQAGPEDGPLLIFLHGFPEFWYGWRGQIAYFAARGYRVWAPDQRGYNLSDKPRDLERYNQDYLAADLVGLIDAAGREKAFVVGHDWGAAVLWWAAIQYPERLEKIAILNVPHHSVFRKKLRESGDQRRRSWYVAFFQIPWLPEAVISPMQARGLARTLQASSRAGTFTDADLAEYQRAWSQPGALTAMLNWYRAVAQRPPAHLPTRRVTVPTLILWGKKDFALRPEMAQESVEYCDDGRLVYFDEATHWIQHEETDRVNALIDEFFSANSPPKG